MSQHATLALVGAVGGAGTTRTAVESGAMLARDGYDVTILDAAFGTQGLADYVEGRIDADLTAVLTEDAELDAATYPIATDAPGRLKAVPACAPFHRFARAMTAGAAERFERQIAAAGLSADVVLVDTPPIATNQAVAAVNAANQVALVTPDTVRGADGLARQRGRLGDLDVAVEHVLATFTATPAVLEEAGTALPESDVVEAGVAPTAGHQTTPYVQAIATFVEDAFGVDLDVEFEASGRLGRLVGGD
jgi:cellulose biosynthesis protein BcsQ